MRADRHKGSPPGGASRIDHIRYIARRALPAAMPETALLPRIVVRGNSALSWDGPAPWSDALATADRALEDFGRLLVWDLGGIERNRPNLEFVRHFEGEAVWVDAGIRVAESVIDVLVAGAERVVVGTKTLRSLEDLEEARELTENLVPLLDFAAGKLWAPDSVLALPPRDLLSDWRGRGTDTVLLLDETGEVPGDLLREPPDGLSVFAGLVSKNDADHLPSR